ncbi:hypothetical protein D3C85_773290 [compost metagenome]|jgi:hypothetical protein
MLHPYLPVSGLVLEKGAVLLLAPYCHVGLAIVVADAGHADSIRVPYGVQQPAQTK